MFKKLILTLIVNCSGLLACAQYLGGSGDGFTLVASGSVSLGISTMYRGGSEDGFARGSATAQSLGNPSFARLANEVPVTTTQHEKENVILIVNWEERNAALIWSCENNGNVMQYVLQRSSDGSSFTDFDQPVTVKKKSSNYKFLDYSAFSSPDDVIYYRIKSIFRDHHVSESSVVSLKKPTGENNYNIHVTPNPASVEFTLMKDAKSGDDMTLTGILYDTNGKVVVADVVAGQPVSVLTLPSGSYFLHVRQGGKKFQILQLLIIH